MHKVPLSYTNFNGETVTKDFYFNLTKAELLLKELESDGTFVKSMEILSTSNKGSVVFPEFKKIVKWAYGEKSADGESFDKSDAVWAKFENSEPWSELMMKLLTEADWSANFIKAIVPPDLMAQVEAQNATPGFRPGADTSRPTPPVAGQPAVPVTAEQPFSAPAQPVQPPVQQPQVLVQPPVQPVYLEPTQPPQVAPQQPDQGVERTSAPRDWIPPQAQQ